jgi:MFS family permease
MLLAPANPSVSGAPSNTRLVTRPFVLVSASTFAYFVAIGVLLPTMPRFVKDGLGGSSVAVGATVTAYGIAAVACRPGLSWWARRFGPRSMMSAGALAATLILLMHPLVRSMVPLIGLRMAMGVAEAMLFVGAATIVNDLAPAARRAEAASYFSVAVFAGLGFGPVVGEALASQAHYTRAFLVAAFCTFVAFGVSRLVPPSPAVAPSAVSPSSSSPSPTRHRLVHPAGLVTGVVLAMAMIGYTGWMTFLPLRADEVGAAAGGLFLFYSGSVLVLRVAGARVPERVGLGRCAAVALVFIGVGLVLSAVVPGAAGLWAGVLVLSVGISLLYPSLMAISVNSVSDAGERAAVVATFTMFFEVGGALGGVLLGGVAAGAGYQGAFLAGGLIALAGLVPLWRLVIVPRRAAPSPVLDTSWPQLVSHAS